MSLSIAGGFKITPLDHKPTHVRNDCETGAICSVLQVFHGCGINQELILNPDMIDIIYLGSTLRAI